METVHDNGPVGDHEHLTVCTTTHARVWEIKAEVTATTRLSVVIGPAHLILSIRDALELAAAIEAAVRATPRD